MDPQQEEFMKKSLLPLALAALAAAGFAQQTKDLGPHAQGDPRELSNTQCQSTFTSGSGTTYMQFCTSANGNISKIQTPSGWDQLYFGGEGYGICDVPMAQAYYDWGSYGDSGNWGPATITQPNGPNTFPLTITRTSSDGVFTLKQAFSRNTTTPAVKVTMTLKNNSGLKRRVYLARFADIDADGNTSNLSGRTEFSAWGTRDNGHGLIARNSYSVSHVVTGFQDPCNPIDVSTPYQGDGASYLMWIAEPNPNSAVTVSMEYRQF
jgi:hypothetical protein